MRASRRPDHDPTTKLTFILMSLATIGILALLLLQLQPNRSVKAQDPEEAYEEEVLKGKDLLRRREYEDALKSFKRANEMRGKKSAECYNLMSEAYLGLEAYKNVIESAEKVLELAGGDKDLILKPTTTRVWPFRLRQRRRTKRNFRPLRRFSTGARYRRCVSHHSLQSRRGVDAVESRS